MAPVTRFFLTCLSLSTAVHVQGTPLIPTQDLIERETASILPRSWTYHSAAPEAQKLHLRVALRQPHKDYLEIAREVSDPSSASYGKHLSRSELHNVLGDTTKSARAVEAWLASHGATGISRKREEVHFTTTVAGARDLLNATFGRYQFEDRNPVLRTRSYSVPRALGEDIDFVYPTVHFLGRKSKKNAQLQARQRGGPATCETAVCPDNVKEVHSIDYQAPDASSGSKIGIAGFLEEWASPEDAKSFLQQYGFRNSSGDYTFSIELVNNGTNPLSPSTSGTEAMLDIDYTMPFTEPLPITYYSTGGRPPTLDEHGIDPVGSDQSDNEPYLEFFQYILDKADPPQVLSISYSDTEQTVPLAYADRVCDLLARLAARGISVIGASGDGGAAGTNEGDCYGPDGKWHFHPTFPSSCPWITSIGATKRSGIAASFSSGGFSNYFGRPSWQDADAESYITKVGDAHAGFYNASGRAIPDVALLGDDFLTIMGGGQSSHDGTSASTPVFASMIALVNDIRLRAGKSVLGFLNPVLYANGTRGVFQDIDDGTTTGCANQTTFETGWDAMSGWDAATGLGFVNFTALREALA